KAAEEAILRAQKALEKSEIKYRSIIENMRLGLLEVDLDGIITRAYPLFCEMVGYTSRELIGQNATTLLLDQENHVILNKQNHARKQGEAGVYEVQINRKDGEKIWVLISGAPFFDIDGNVIGSIGIHYDISDRKKLEKDLNRAKEEAERAQEAEAQFLASMSHEIRTPLNAVLGMTHLLEDTPLNEEQEEYLRVLRHSADILKGLISDILDISKIDAGKVEIHNKPLNLRALLQSIESIYHVKTDSKPVSVKAFIDPRIRTPLLGDELILNQILHNLMSNAEKFTEEGHIHLRANVLSEEGNDTRIKFDVEDTGIGIEGDKLELIFEEFKQANAEIRKSHGGTGLGLAITTKLVELCQGTMDVRSRMGAGSTFSFTLPFKKTDDIKVAEDKSVKILEGFEVEHKPILIAEDNPMNRKYISKLLEKWNLIFEIVENGAQAVEKATKNLYSMIIMDLQMPEMTGMEATQWIRKHENPNQKTPIVALTASTLLSKKEEALDAGMSDFLTKPFHPGSLHEVISKYIRLDEHTVSLIDSNNLPRSKKSPIDQIELQKLYGDDREYKRISFQMFIDTSQIAMDELFRVIQQGDYRKIASFTHRIRPNFGMIGLMQCMKQMADLERMAREQVELEIIKTTFESISKHLYEAWPHIVKEAEIKENQI
ncbi:MAG: response regulator, partial [Saprospiraceae bacterium]|nr:response regulator [Saprospiraceae bacterium]